MQFAHKQALMNFKFSFNHMRVPEGAADRRFLTFFFQTWKEIAPSALKNKTPGEPSNGPTSTAVANACTSTTVVSTSFLADLLTFQTTVVTSVVT